MNKRGQMYILAAVLLCVAIYGVMSITNRLEVPPETNFDFYVENFKGERSYVVDLGLLVGEEMVMDVGEKPNLLDIFTNFGWGSGIVYVEYDGGTEWTVTNYLGQSVNVGECEDCEKISIPAGTFPAAALSFDIGKKYYVEESELGELTEGKWFSSTFSGDSINLEISGNDYNFRSSEGKRIESIVFQNIDENYVKVVRL